MSEYENDYFSRLCNHADIEHQEKISEIHDRQKPHLIRGAKVFKDGNAWCCLDGSPKEVAFVEVCHGFGDTPKEACDNFDKMWSGD